jgi:flagellar biosynthetic protein FliR
VTFGYENIIAYIEVFFAVFARCIGLVLSLAIFGSRGIPAIARIGLALFLAVAMLPVLGDVTLPQNIWTYCLKTAEELFLGLAMGYIINLVFVAIQMGGSFIDLPIGFRAANLVDPQWGYPVPLIGHFKYLMALALFFVMDGHHMVLRGLATSFEILPTAGFSPDGPARMGKVVVDLFATSFIMALKMSLPVAGALFLTDCAFAMLARAAPQINVFLLGFAVKILVGIAILAITLPYFVEYFIGTVEEIYKGLITFLYAL